MNNMILINNESPGTIQYMFGGSLLMAVTCARCVQVIVLALAS